MKNISSITSSRGQSVFTEQTAKIVRWGVFALLLLIHSTSVHAAASVAVQWINNSGVTKSIRIEWQPAAGGDWQNFAIPELQTNVADGATYSQTVGLATGDKIRAVTETQAPQIRPRQ